MKIKSYYKIKPEDWLLDENPHVSNTKKKAMADPSLNLEEYVRQWVLRELISSYNYPKEWLGERIVIEYTVMVNTTTTNFVDIAILNERGTPYLFIECKKIDEKLDGPGKAINQLKASLSVTYTTNLGMATNGDETRCFRKQIDPKEFVPHFDVPEYKLRNNLTHEQPSKLIKPTSPEIVSERKTGLEELNYRSFSTLLFDCHNIMRDHQGLHADQALDEMCKLIYTKIYDEISTPYDANFRLQTWIYSSTEELASTVRTLYSEAKKHEMEEMEQRIRGYSASRGVFRDELKINDSVIEQLVEKIQKFSIVDTKIDIRGKAFEKFLKGKIRQSMGQYFTPDPVIRLMVGILDPNESDLIIDPACGSARFLTKCLDYVRHRHIVPKFQEDSEIDKNFREKRLHGIEISSQLCRLAMTDMMMHGDGRTNVRCTSGLASWDSYTDVVKNSFSICITNPPFGSKIREEDILRRFKFGCNQNGKGIRKGQKKEVLFLERCLELLQPGGKLAIVLPEGLLENSRDLYVRKGYREYGKVVAIIKLPSHTFVPFGANVETSVLFLRKWKDGENKTINYPIFMAKLSDITYDTIGNDCMCRNCLNYRKDPEKHPDEIAKLIKYFHGCSRW